ncbi:MAG: helix-turn-helix domain-containing protein [Ruminococcaceae bacterium]|nr:helix-turn-helix domain-containing protein [Oscillospiraceae bacterium]
MATKIPVLFEVMSQRKITLKQLGDNIGASTGNISDWKSGRATPGIEALTKIADYLGCSTDYLLGRTDNSQNTESDIDPELAEAIKLFANLPSDKRKGLLDFLKTFSK